MAKSKATKSKNEKNVKARAQRVNTPVMTASAPQMRPSFKEEEIEIVAPRPAPTFIDKNEVRHCPSCGSTDIIFDNEKGEYICNNCGLIIEENVTDTGPEWRAFDTDQRNTRARTGAPIRYMKPNKGLVTEIDMYNKDIRGTKLPSKRQAQLYRMRKWHKRASIASSGSALPRSCL